MQTTAKQFFNDYAAALLSYDADKIAAFYQVPMSVYSDQGVQLVNEMQQVTAFWQQGVVPYKEAGITDAKPEIMTEEELTNNITIVKVRWLNTKDDGSPAGEETNAYILSNGNDGVKISGLIIMGQ